MKSPRTWVVVVDAHAARFFERLRRTEHVVEKPELTLSAPPRPKERAKAPRVHERLGPMRHRIEARTAPRIAHEKAFLETVAAELKRHADAEAFDQLIISAPPRAVGMLRLALSHSVKTKLKDVWTKELVHEAASDIERRLHASNE